MTIGPEPMMRILLMSVLLGIVETCGGRRRCEGGRGRLCHALLHSAAYRHVFYLSSGITHFGLCSLPESVRCAPAALLNSEGNTRARLRKAARRFVRSIPR